MCFQELLHSAPDGAGKSQNLGGYKHFAPPEQCQNDFSGKAESTNQRINESTHNVRLARDRTRTNHLVDRFKSGSVSETLF